MALDIETQWRGAKLPDLETERAIIALIFRSAKLADDRKFVEWVDTFVEDGVYAALTCENKNYKGLHLFRDVGKRALHVRAAFLLGLWQVPRGKTLHLVTNTQVFADSDTKTARSFSNFLITRTGHVEHSELHACGVYEDVFERQDSGSWLFKSREVIVDSNLLPPEFTELL